MVILDFNVFTFMFDLIFKLSSLYTVMYNFLFKIINVGQYSFSMWSLLGGGVITSLLVMKIIKKVVPLI